MDTNNSVNGWWWVALFGFPIIGTIWLLFMLGSMFFGQNVLGTLAEYSGLISNVLGVLTAVLLILAIMGVGRILRSRGGLIGPSMQYGWLFAKKTVKTWFVLIISMLVLIGGLTYRSNSYLVPVPTTIDTLMDDGDVADSFFSDFDNLGAERTIAPGYEAHYYVLEAIGNIISILFGLFIVSGAISVVYSQKLEIKNFRDKITLWVVIKYIGGFLVYGFLILVGLVLLIIPGIIVMVRGKFFNVAIIKDGLGPIDAFRKSRAITKGHFWELVGFNIMQGIVSVLGFLAIGIGLFWSLPTVWIADLKAYKLLSGEEDDLDEDDLDDDEYLLDDGAIIDDSTVVQGPNNG